jgi:hypothetical protein
VARDALAATRGWAGAAVGWLYRPSDGRMRKASTLMTKRRSRLRWLIPLVCVGVAGCVLVGAGSVVGAVHIWRDYQSHAPRGKRGDTAAEQVTQLLAARPDVLGVSVSYTYNVVTDPGSVDVRVCLTPHGDADGFVDEAAGRLWQSRIAPLDTITVNFFDTATLDWAGRLPRSRQVYPQEFDDATMLRRYGRRPVPGR